MGDPWGVAEERPIAATPTAAPPAGPAAEDPWGVAEVRQTTAAPRAGDFVNARSAMDVNPQAARRPQPAPSAPAPRRPATPVPNWTAPLPPSGRRITAPNSPGGQLLPLIRRLERSGDTATSPAGARGRYQIMPGTARQYGFDPDRLYDPVYNTMVATVVLNDLHHRYRGEVPAILAAYNGGPGRANTWLRQGRNNAVLPSETQAYLRRGGYGDGRRSLFMPGGLTNFLIRGAQSFLGGAIQGTGAAIEGVARTVDDYVRARAAGMANGGYVDPVTGQEVAVPAALSAAMSPVAQNFRGAEHGTSPLTSYLRRVGAQTAPADRNGVESFLWGGGQMAPGFAAAFIPGVGPVAAGAYFGGQGSTQTYEEARQAGASDDRARRAATQSALLEGIIGSLPVGEAAALGLDRLGGAALRRLPEGLRTPLAAAARGLPRAGDELSAVRPANIAGAFGGNAALSAGLQVAHNDVARREYDPRRSLWHEVPEQALIGGVIGGAMQVGIEGSANVIHDSRAAAATGRPAAPAAPVTPAAASLPPGVPPGAARAFNPAEMNLPRGVDPQAVEAAMQAEGARAEHMERAVADVVEARSPPEGGRDLLSEIRQLGGVRTTNPDGSLNDIGTMLRAAGRTATGVGKAKGGLDADRLRMALQERGWWGEQTGGEARPAGERPGDHPNDLIELLDSRLRGGRVVHPEDSTPELRARQGALDEEMVRAGVTAADSTPIAAAKVAKARQNTIDETHVRDFLMSRAEELGVEPTPEWSNDDLQVAIIEREAIQGEYGPEEYHRDEELIDDGLTPEELEWLEANAPESFDAPDSSPDGAGAPEVPDAGAATGDRGQDQGAGGDDGGAAGPTGRGPEGEPGPAARVEPDAEPLNPDQLTIQGGEAVERRRRGEDEADAGGQFARDTGEEPPIPRPDDGALDRVLQAEREAQADEERARQEGEAAARATGPTDDRVNPFENGTEASAAYDREIRKMVDEETAPARDASTPENPWFREMPGKARGGDRARAQIIPFRSPTGEGFEVRTDYSLPTSGSSGGGPRGTFPTPEEAQRAGAERLADQMIGELRRDESANRKGAMRTLNWAREEMGLSPITKTELELAIAQKEVEVFTREVADTRRRLDETLERGADPGPSHPGGVLGGNDAQELHNMRRRQLEAAEERLQRAQEAMGRPEEPTPEPTPTPEEQAWEPSGRESEADARQRAQEALDRADAEFGKAHEAFDKAATAERERGGVARLSDASPEFRKAQKAYADATQAYGEAVGRAQDAGIDTDGARVRPTRAVDEQAQAQGQQAVTNARDFQPSAMPRTTADPPEEPPPGTPARGETVDLSPDVQSIRPPDAPRAVVDVSPDGAQVTLDGGQVVPTSKVTKPRSGRKKGNGLQGDLFAGPGEGQPGPVPGSAPQRDAGQPLADAEPGSAPPAGRSPGEGATDAGRSDQGPAGREAGRGDGDGGVSGLPDGERGAGTTGRPDAADDVTGTDWTIEPGSLGEDRGPKQKARGNLDAIRIVKTLEAEGRLATKAEQAELAKYVGWGGLARAFDPQAADFADIHAQLRQLLTREEYDAARRSTQYAHYTSERVISSMWDAVRSMGFRGGQVFEPGMGIGHFRGLMPGEIAAASHYSGLEMDPITASIAKALYPNSGIRQADYTTTPMPENQFDLVIGNPPFADIQIKADPKYAARNFLLHDYFFAKSLDSVRPGGLLAFVTSAGTMNKIDVAARRFMADRADFLGGVRLPSTAFAENAGTEVTTDILFFKRREEGEAAGDASWTETVRRDLPDSTGKTTPGNVNRYFSDHPEQVLGREGFFDKLYKGRYAVHAEPGADLSALLAGALDRLPKDVYSAPLTPQERAAIDFSANERKEGAFYLKDGALHQVVDGIGRPVARRGKEEGGLTAIDVDRITHYVPVRDALRDVMRLDILGDERAATAARATLNKTYDAFVKKFGPLNKAEFQYRRPTAPQVEAARLAAREDARERGEAWDDGSFDPSELLELSSTPTDIAKARAAAKEQALARGQRWEEGSFNPDDLPDTVIVKRPNFKPLSEDPEAYRLAAHERYNDSTGQSEKGRIFRESIYERPMEPRLESAGDGVLWSLNEHGRLDLDAIAAKMNRTRASLIAELGDSVFKLPGTDAYQTASEYLSGDVVSKLAEAEAAEGRDPDIRRNVEALRAAQPAPLAPSEITMTLGMPWTPREVMVDFAAKHLRIGRLKFKFNALMGDWRIEGYATGPEAARWGTEDMGAREILKAAMNRQWPKIWRKDGEGNRYVDQEATDAVHERIREVRQAYEDYTAEGTPVRETLANGYNETQNRTVLRVFDGGYLTTPGIAKGWSWRPHQQRVVARIIQAGNTYMAHAVGAGKTSAMIGAVMEMRRLGLVRKPLITIPDHMLGQFAKEFYEQYPTAKIMVADPTGAFSAHRRKAFVARAAAEDLDAIIMPHTSFGMIGVSDEFQAHLIQTELARIDETMEGLDRSEDRTTIKRLEKLKERLEQQMRGAMSNRKDQVITFEEMGVDHLTVDEAHTFRKLSFASKLGLKGIDGTGSQRSWDLFAKIQYLETRNPGRSTVLASGTPVTNTMGELFTISRYMQSRELEARGLSQFDAWANTFGDTKTELEPTASGEYELVTRFSRFVNAPELYKMVGQVMDVVTPGQLEQYVVRPKLKGGQRNLHMAPRTKFLDRFQANLAARVKAIRLRKGPPAKGEDIILKVINDGRLAAIDPRLVGERNADNQASKLDEMIANVAQIYTSGHDTAFYDPATGYERQHANGPSTQMIFANLGINPTGPLNFSVNRHIRRQLEAMGVKREHIAFIEDFKNPTARQRLFNDMNEGKVRILVGSTAKMGTGVNAQRRLAAIHNLDPLWFPADDEQRVGRGLRQGNWNPELEIHDYSTTDTYDATMWQMMGRKGRFIEQFFRGDPEMRNMEDLGEASAFEQAAAMTISDKRVFRLTELRQTLDKIKRRASAHEAEQYGRRRQIEVARARIPMREAMVRSLDEAIAKRKPTAGEEFAVTINGAPFAERPKAAAAFEEAYESAAAAMRTGESRVIGELGGFPMLVKKLGESDVEFHFRLPGGRELEFGAESASGTGILRSAEMTLVGMDGEREFYRQQNERDQNTIESLTRSMGEPFRDTDKMDALQDEIAALEAELEAGPAQAPTPVEAPTAPTPTPNGGEWTSISREPMGSASDPWGVADIQDGPVSFQRRRDPDTYDMFEQLAETDPDGLRRPNAGPFAYPTADPERIHFDQNHADLYRLGKAMQSGETTERLLAEAARLADHMGRYMDWSDVRPAGPKARPFELDSLPPADFEGEGRAPPPEEMLKAAMDYAEDVDSQNGAGTSYYDPDAYYDAARRFDRLQGGARPMFERRKEPLLNRDGTVQLAKGLRGVPETSALFKTTREAMAQIEEMARRIHPSADVKAYRSLHGHDEGKPQDGYRIEGATWGYKDGRVLIAYSLGSQDVVHTARHELAHGLRRSAPGDQVRPPGVGRAIRNSGLYHPAEWHALERAALRETNGRPSWFDQYDIGNRYADKDWEEQLEEAIVERFGDWHKRHDAIDPRIRPLFQRLERMLSVVRRALLDAFKAKPHWADVMRMMDEGVIGRRAYEVPAGGFPAKRTVGNIPGAVAGRADMRAYHGTPHEFDRFDSENIGRGEGAQAYGHGLYFAGARKVAEHYRDQLSTPTLDDLRAYYEPGRIIDGYGGTDRVIRFIEEPEGPWAWSVEVQRVTRNAEGQWVPAEPARIHSTMPDPKKVGAAIGRGIGRLYEVEIPHHNEFLNRDLPLIEQPLKVREAAWRAMAEAGVNIDGDPNALTGRQVYDSISEYLGQRRVGEVQEDGGAPHGWSRVEPEYARDDAGASDLLAAAGLPGLSYRDAMLRHTNVGEHNYVVFDDGDVEIAAKYMVSPTPAPREFDLVRVGRLSADLAKALGIPHRQGRLRSKGSLGEYNAKTGVVRTKPFQELDALSQAGGLALENRKLPALDRAIRDHATKLAAIPPLTLKKGRREAGFAMFFQQYVTNPRAARRSGGDFFDAFEAAMEKADPKMFREIQAVQQAYQGFLKAAPADAMAASIVDPSEVTTMARTIREFGKNPMGAVVGLADRAYTAFVDDLNPINVATRFLQRTVKANSGRDLDLIAAKDPYALARLSRDAYGGAMMDLLHGVAPYHGTEAASPSLSAALEKALGEGMMGRWEQQKYRQFGAYLISRRMVHEWKAYDNGERYDKPPDRFSGEYHERVIAQMEKMHPTFAEAAGMVYEFNNASLKLELDAGLITQEAYEAALRDHPDYVPAMRDRSDMTMLSGPGGGPSATGKGAGGLDRMRGSQRDFMHPITSIMQRQMHLRGVIARNDVFKALDWLALKAGRGSGHVVERLAKGEPTKTSVDIRDALTSAAETYGLAPRDVGVLMQTVEDLLPAHARGEVFRMGEINERGEPIVYVWNQGEKQPLRLGDGQQGLDLYYALTGLNRQAKNLWTEVAAAPSQILRFGVTSDPSFLVANYVRDQVSTWMTSESGFTPFVAGAKGMALELAQGETSQLYNRVGGIMGGENVASLDKARVEQNFRALDRRGIHVKRFTSLRGVLKATEISETGTRLGAFTSAYKAAKARGLSDYDAAIEAAYEARDIIDFGRRGSQMLSAVRTVTFLNAGIQGTDKALRVASGNKTGAAPEQLREVFKRIMGAPGGTPAQQRAAVHARKFHAKMVALGLLGLTLAAIFRDDEEVQEASNYLRATHWVMRLPGVGIVTVPKPFELAWYSTVLERGFEAVALRDPTAWGRLWGDAGETLVPPHDVVALNVPFDIASNRTHSGGQVVPDYLRNVDPREQYTAYTSRFSRILGRATGASPAVMDYAITGVGGTLGRSFLSATDLGARRPMSPAPENMPVAQRFIRDPTRGTRSQNEFWRLMNTRDGAFNRISETLENFRRLGPGADARGAAYINGLKRGGERDYAITQMHTGRQGASLHPLNRAREAMTVLSAVRRELVTGDIATTNGRRIEMTPEQRRAADRALGRYIVAEARNALVAAGVEGFAQRNELPISAAEQELRQASPAVADAVRDRLRYARVISAAENARRWPAALRRMRGDYERLGFSELASRRRMRSPGGRLIERQRAVAAQ